MAFWSKLSGLFESSQKGFLKTVLMGAGVSLTTAAVSMTAFNVAYQAFKHSIDSIPANLLALAHLSGFDIAITIILTAVVTRMTLNASNLTLTRATRQ